MAEKVCYEYLQFLYVEKGKCGEKCDMTIGEIIDEIVTGIAGWFDGLAIKPKIDEIIESNEIIKTIIGIPGKMAHSFTEIFSGKQWGWIFAFVFCVVAAVILWKSLAGVMEVLVKTLLMVACVVLVAAVVSCVLIERIDVAILIVLLLIVLLVLKHFYPKPPEDKK